MDPNTLEWVLDTWTEDTKIGVRLPIKNHSKEEIESWIPYSWTPTLEFAELAHKHGLLYDGDSIAAPVPNSAGFYVMHILKRDGFRRVHPGRVWEDLTGWKKKATPPSGGSPSLTWYEGPRAGEWIGKGKHYSVRREAKPIVEKSFDPCEEDYALLVNYC
jgi:hypothetical protein